MTNLKHPFEKLTPDYLLDAIESQGYHCDGRFLALNSYENRVYQIGLEEADPIIAKFYRPQRWTDNQINEEHAFCFELVEQELPVVTPLQDKHDNSLLTYNEFRFALFPRKGGRAPELDNPDNLFILGRLLGRMHLIGSSQSFQHRPALDSQSYGHDSVSFITQHFIPDYLKSSYETLTHDILNTIDSIFHEHTHIKIIRAHSDCHIGNMLWRDDAPHFVDFDDARMAPAIQDIWMLLSGDRQQQTVQLMEILEGYEEFNTFDLRELHLIEALRTLRMLHYSAWLARRWDDPAFPRNFPWFNTPTYWDNHILELREQFAALQEPGLELSR